MNPAKNLHVATATKSGNVAQPTLHNSMPPIPTNIEFSLTDWDDEASIQLREAQRAEILQEYRRAPGSEPSATDIPIFVVLKVDGVPAACGGLRPLVPEGGVAAEIKRMFVLPEYRGAACMVKGVGLGSLVLRGLETQALLRGWKTLKLGTGSGMMAARRFYEREGFEQVELWGRYVDAPDSVCYEKVLAS